MKHLKLILLLLVLGTSFSAFSQKVKVKGESVLIDEVETYKLEKEGKSRTLSTTAGNEFITLIKDGFEHFQNGNRFYTTVYTVKFLGSGNEVLTDMSEKDVIKAIYKSGMVSADGKIDEEKMNVFVNKFHNENLKYKLAK